MKEGNSGKGLSGGVRRDLESLLGNGIFYLDLGR